MKMKKDENITQLLEKYLDGDTSNNEERILADYFRKAGDDVPEEWRPYKALFAYLATEKESSGESKVRSITPTPQKASKPRWSRQTTRYAWIGAAAAVLVGVLLVTPPKEENNYAVIDGKVYTNKKIVEAEALDALMQVSVDDEDTYGALEMMRQ